MSFEFEPPTISQEMYTWSIVCSFYCGLVPINLIMTTTKKFATQLFEYLMGFTVISGFGVGSQEPLLLLWINFNHSMDK